MDTYTRKRLVDQATEVAANLASHTPAAIQAVEDDYARDNGRDPAGVGYAVAYGQLRARALHLCQLVERAAREDAQLEASRPSITKLMAEASARMAYAPDEETADYEARMTAAAVTLTVDLPDIVALAREDDRITAFPVRPEDVGRPLVLLMADRVEELLADYLRDQWAEATASETGNAGLRAA